MTNVFNSNFVKLQSFLALATCTDLGATFGNFRASLGPPQRQNCISGRPTRTLSEVSLRLYARWAFQKVNDLCVIQLFEYLLIILGNCTLLKYLNPVVVQF